jgi:hypothetical protein
MLAACFFFRASVFKVRTWSAVHSRRFVAFLAIKSLPVLGRRPCSRKCQPRTAQTLGGSGLIQRSPLPTRYVDKRACLDSTRQAAGTNGEGLWFSKRAFHRVDDDCDFEGRRGSGKGRCRSLTGGAGNRADAADDRARALEANAVTGAGNRVDAADDRARHWKRTQLLQDRCRFGLQRVQGSVLGCNGHG